jgi:GMP synthase-like glutamine amidotransferase
MQTQTPLIGILACDRPATPELLERADGETYGDMYVRMLTQADPTIRTRVYDVDLGEMPVTVDECDAWIITGARFDAYRDEPWIAALRDFVTLVARARIRAAGVCFGHQLIAHALGGTAASAGEWRIGPETMIVEPTAWFEGGTVTLHAVHQDVVTALPPGARSIATGSTAAVPAYLVGDTILGVQDHPEFTDDYVAALIEARRKRLGDALADEALERIATIPTEGSTVGRWLVDFLVDRRR